MPKTKDWIVTDSDLQRDPNLILKHAQQRPLIVTAEGRPTAYVLSVEMFDALLERMLELERADLVHHLAKGEREFDSGDFVTLQEAVASAEAAWQLQESAA